MQEAFIEVGHHKKQVAPVSVGQLVGVGTAVGAAVGAPVGAALFGVTELFGVTHIPPSVAHAPAVHMHLPLMQEAFLEASQVGGHQQVPPVSCEQSKARAQLSIHMHTSARTNCIRDLDADATITLKGTDSAVSGGSVRHR